MTGLSDWLTVVHARTLIHDRHTKSGDTILDTKDTERFVLEQLLMPQPVFMASLEYNSLKDKPLLDVALQIICREDNSLVVKDDKETG